MGTALAPLKISLRISRLSEKWYVQQTSATVYEHLEHVEEQDLRFGTVGVGAD
jgi:hypothetical protein